MMNKPTKDRRSPLAKAREKYRKKHHHGTVFTDQAEWFFRAGYTAGRKAGKPQSLAK